MTRRGRSEPVPPGAASPRPAKSVCHVSPSRTIHSYCPDEFGWARRSPVRERERERPESCPARPLRRTHCRTIFLAGAAGQTVHSEALSVGARPAATRPLLCCLLPASGLRWAGRSYPPPDRPFPLGRRILPFKMRKLSFSHHFCIIPTPYFPNNIGRRRSLTFIIPFQILVSKPNDTEEINTTQ